jgi:hypothetical protein
MLKDDFVCGYKDITHEPYAGTSGSHGVQGKVAKTTNGAGPHNIQMFVIAPDGAVLHALTGYWYPQDLARELVFAEQLNALYGNPTLSIDQKKTRFRQLQLAHVQSHPADMVRRSHLQGFDALYEAQHKLATTDTIRDTGAVKAALANHSHVPMDAFKTTDEIVHERMAQRPFVPYDKFDIATFVDYGKLHYDKDEDMRDTSGRKIQSAFMNESALPRHVERTSVLQSYSWNK